MGQGIPIGMSPIPVALGYIDSTDGKFYPLNTDGSGNLVIVASPQSSPSVYDSDNGELVTTTTSPSDPITTDNPFNMLNVVNTGSNPLLISIDNGKWISIPPDNGDAGIRVAGSSFRYMSTTDTTTFYWYST